MRSYIGKKSDDYWLWTVVADKRIKFFEIGKRTEETFYALEEKLILLSATTVHNQ